MHIFKILLFVLAILSFNTPANAENQVSYKEFARIMKANKAYCTTETGVIERNKLRGSNFPLCIRHCEEFSLIQNSPNDGYIKPGKAGEGLRTALNNCIKYHAEIKQMVDTAKLTRSSISETLGLKVIGYKREVDRGYNQCMDVAKSSPHVRSAEGCLCTAKSIISAINERGSYSRVHVAFTRLVPECRGL